jgi:hypothetical protein
VRFKKCLYGTDAGSKDIFVAYSDGVLVMCAVSFFAVLGLELRAFT